jgi:hypothetical protein
MLLKRRKLFIFALKCLIIKCLKVAFKERFVFLHGSYTNGYKDKENSDYLININKDKYAGFISY